MTERIKAWQCIGCGRIDGPQNCIGICEDRKVEFVYAVEHDDAQPARAGAPGRGQADDAASNDGDVETAGRCRMDSLRRHDPEQVLTVGDRIAALSASLTARLP